MSLQEDLRTNVPHLRAFALLFCGNAVQADDLVQKTIEQAIASKSTLATEANVRMALFAILHDLIHNEPVKETTSNELLSALQALPPEEREAYILVDLSEFSCTDAAEVSGIDPLLTLLNRDLGFDRLTTSEVRAHHRAA